MNIIKNARKEIAREKAAIKRREELLRDPVVLEQVRKIAKATRKYSPEMSTFLGYPLISYRLNVKSFREGPLVDLLDRLIDAGVLFTNSIDYPASGIREYRGRTSGGVCSVHVDACISQDEQASCSVVKVGEEIVSKPVYQIVCH